LAKQSGTRTSVATSASVKASCMDWSIDVVETGRYEVPQE
jgi:hypothetical protein